MKFRPAIALLSLLLATSLFAADAPKPDPKLKELDYFTGTWACKGTETFDGPTIHYTETVVGTWILNHFWLDIRVTQQKSKENAMPFAGRGFLGYDAEAKKFVVGWVDNTGGYETSQFDGWDGNKISWEGTYHMGTMSAKGRDVFTKVTAKKQTHTFELEQGGKWVEVMNETCTRE
jgi:hypothetical protein